MDSNFFYDTKYEGVKENNNMACFTSRQARRKKLKTLGKKRFPQSDNSEL